LGTAEDVVACLLHPKNARTTVEDVLRLTIGTFHAEDPVLDYAFLQHEHDISFPHFPMDKLKKFLFRFLQFLCHIRLWVDDGKPDTIRCYAPDFLPEDNKTETSFTEIQQVCQVPTMVTFWLNYNHIFSSDDLMKVSVNQFGQYIHPAIEPYASFRWRLVLQKHIQTLQQHVIAKRNTPKPLSKLQQSADFYFAQNRPLFPRDHHLRDMYATPEIVELLEQTYHFHSWIDVIKHCIADSPIVFDSDMDLTKNLMMSFWHHLHEYITFADQKHKEKLTSTNTEKISK
jgi:hypothetical protein